MRTSCSPRNSIGHPAEGQRHFALLALHQLQLAAVAAFEPAEELGGVADRGREQQQATCARQHAERQFPDDAALRIGEVVKFVHDDGRDVVEIEALRMQQAIEQNLGDDDEDAGVGIDAAIAGDEADVVGLEAPTHGRVLHLLELLLGQRDERRGVIGDVAGVQCLEQRGLGDERLAGAGGAQTSTPCSAVNQASRASSWTG